MIRRSIETGELAYYHPGGPVVKSDLVRVAGARWPIEECFGVGKSTIGMDDYQVRKCDVWHRHITTMAMLAHTFLAVTVHTFKKSPTTTGVKRFTRLIRLTMNEICRLLGHARTHGLDLALGWSRWRREHQADARRAHFRKRLRRQQIHRT